MDAPRYPSLYQINTRVWLTALSQTLGRPATLDDIPDEELDRLAARGFDWIWLLSVWRTGLAAQAISRANLEWRHEFEETLPDLREEETIVGINGSMVNGTSVIRPSPGGFAGVRPHTAVHCWSRAVPLTQRALGTQALPSGPGPAYARTTTSGVVVRERDRKPARRVPARDSPQAGAWPCPRAPTSRRFKRRTRLTCAVMPFALAGHATSAPGGVAMKSALESTGCR